MNWTRGFVIQRREIYENAWEWHCSVYLRWLDSSSIPFNHFNGQHKQFTAVVTQCLKITQKISFCKIASEAITFEQHWFDWQRQWWIDFTSVLLADMVNKMLSSLKITIKVSFYNITSEASYVYFRFFLNKMNINLIDKDNDGWTHFCFAYGYGQQDVVK